MIGIFQFCLASNKSISLNLVEHGDLHQRILEVTHEISERPDSAFLYFKRSKLYFEHENYTSAVSDLDTAAILNYNGIICDLIYAKSFQQLDQLDKAMSHVEQILQQDSINVNALKIKGKLFLDQQQYKEAAEQFNLVLKHVRRRLPENYLLAAKAHELDSLEKEPRKAITVLQKGIEDLGQLYIFHDEMINVYMKHSLFEEALKVQETIIKQAKRKEKSYYKAALISLQMQDLTLASEYLHRASSAIETLPTRLKTTPAIKQLKKNISKQQSILQKH